MAQFTLPNGHNYFVDSAGRLLIFSCGIDGLDLKDPRTLTKTTGKVLPSSNTCIDDARWQYIRNTLAPSLDDWRLAVATTDSTVDRACDTFSNERSRLLTASARNINSMLSYNSRALPSSLTDWLFSSEFSGGGSVQFCWDEDSGSDGTGLDYSGIIFQSPTATPASPYRGFGIYSQSSKPIFGLDTFSYFHRNLEFWILPPGVPDFDTERPYLYSTDGGGLSHNPGDPASNHQYGWFTRSGGTNTDPVGNGTKPFQGDCRQLVLVWDGVVIFDSIDSPIIVAPAQGTTDDFVSWAGAGTSVIGNTNYTYPVNSNCGVVVGNYVYYAGAFQGSEYGWPNAGVGYSAPSGLADYCNGFQIKRRRYFPSTPIYTGNKSNGQSSTIPANATNIFFDINGGRGGRGGTALRTEAGAFGADVYHYGGEGMYGQRICGYINYQGLSRTFSHYIGGNGGNGSTTFGGNGGAGGLASGGRGGDCLYYSSERYGGGGGGAGAASGLKIGSNTIVVSGGGGGGGGGQSRKLLGVYDYETGTLTYPFNASPNLDFTQFSSEFSAENGTNCPNNTVPSDNAGSGGGGGGKPKGNHGPIASAGNGISGAPGEGGGGAILNTFVETGYIVPEAPYPVAVTSPASSYEYEEYDDFLAVYGSANRNSNWSSSAYSQLYYYSPDASTYAEEVGIRLKIYDNGSWVPVKEMYVKDGDTWKLVQDCYIKKDEEWRPFYG